MEEKKYRELTDDELENLVIGGYSHRQRRRYNCLSCQHSFETSYVYSVCPKCDQNTLTETLLR
ncbi:MAG: hypothetical protein LBM59_03415 [Ruminococcus sp.]|jgi:rubrerythrin|nr:hypothetical protein [Ruminococcus sp.]